MSENPLAKLYNIDKVRSKTIQIKLEDALGDEIKISDILEQLYTYISDQFSSSEINICTQQIHPLITEILVKSIKSSFKDETLAITTLAQPELRTAMIQQMLTTFYFLKFIQKNKIKIVSLEEDISKQDLEKIVLQDKLSSYIVTARLSGLSMQEIINAIMVSGIISKDDLIESNIFPKEEIEKWISK